MPDANSSLHVLAQPACRHLLSKGMYMTGQLDPADDPHNPMGDGYCWCNLTQHLLGPDDNAVNRANCTAGRSCYVAL